MSENKGYQIGQQRFDRMPGNEYHSTRALSSTILKTASVDGWTAAKHVWAGERELDSRAVVIGSAVALYVESKAMFASTYMEAPQDYKTSTSQKFAAFAQDNGIDATRLLTETEFDTVCRIGSVVREAVYAYRPSDHLVSEPSFFWYEGSLLCKCRPDVYIDGGDVPPDYIEIKTATSVSPRAVKSSFFRYAYHLQQAWYERGITKVVGTIPRVTFLFVSTVPPHDIRCYRLSDLDAVAAGIQCGDLLDEFRKRANSGNWTDDTLQAPTEIHMGLANDFDLEGVSDAINDL
jgi:hypothetical protein